jgi:Anti-sigma-K factor rskA/Sigma-70, region 4
MGALDNLPPDQRAVLQMVLQRGRSYDEIANVLSIERAAVRQRALDGFDALTPPTVLPGPERALVTDYLLGQLPDKVAEQVYSFLQASDADREWAQALVAELSPLTSRALPEIPAGAPLGAGHWPAGGLEDDSDQPAIDAPLPLEDDDQLDADEEAVVAGAIAGASASPDPSPAHSWDPPAGSQPARPSSRRGGAILLAIIAVVIVAAILVGLLSSGGSKPKHATRRTTPTTSTTSTTAASPQPLVQLNLTSPTRAKDTVGVADVVSYKGVLGVVVDAQGLPANTKHNAYAVWLAKSSGGAKFVGFVPNLVGKDGKLTAEGRLPANAPAYNRLLITLETQSKPTAPGEVVLSGPFREHP